MVPSGNGQAAYKDGGDKKVGSGNRGILVPQGFLQGNGRRTNTKAVQQRRGQPFREQEQI